MLSRRNFLYASGLLGGFGLAPFGVSSVLSASGDSTSLPPYKPVKFGLISDIHLSHFPNAVERLEAFLARVEIEKPDFILNLGDFCFSYPENRGFVDRYSNCGTLAYHVLGNHELDRHTKEEALSFFGLSSGHYSVDLDCYHLVVLDPNSIFSEDRFIPYDKGNYSKHGGNVSYIDDEQCDWLEEDLKKTTLPTFVFSHQSLVDDKSGIPNRSYVKNILKQANESSISNGSGKKVLACFNGHHHLDAYRMEDGIHYFGINSASYFFGNKTPPRFDDPELYQKFPRLPWYVPYKDSLFCFVTVDANGTLSLKGRKSEWIGPPFVGPSSKSIRFSQGNIVPEIRDRKVQL